ncbi:DNA polymerase III subunit delta [uncultured Phascolarctobacterium sp.]|uniref:DNA polymerase III subunit delta n=1 Tax=uncultured Phascolarctobacterium sp. TaxID=512296 RepID=UPI0027D97880|nr:DNA polymerase III subunit delta [uncultured Phascolarctobacterium sp.]
MEITAEKIMQQLHKGEQVASVIAVFGEEGYYKDKIAAALPQAVFGEAAQEDREVTVFERDTDLKELSAVINTYPFFSGRSLVVLKDEKLWGGKDAGEKRKQQQEELAVLLADVPDHCQVLVLGEKIDKRSKLYKSLLKTAAMVECKPVKAYQLKPWLDEQAAVRGCRFDYEASQTIMEYLSVTDNAPLLLLEQEIEKLAVYAGQRKIWTQNDVEQVFAALPEVSRFALLNAIAEKRLGQALQLLGEERKHGNTVLALCGLISFQVRRLGRVKELLEGSASQAEIASELKAAPFAIKKMIEQSRRFQLGELERALLELSQLNIEVRYGGRQFEKLEEIIIKLLSD